MKKEIAENKEIKDNKDELKSKTSKQKVSSYSKNPNFYEIDGGEKIEVISSKIEQIITL